MRDSIVALNKEVDSITLVVDKLMGKQNVSVFEKICQSCANTFDSFNRFSVQDIVQNGCVKEAIDFLHKLLEQVKKLKTYKEGLIAYMEMQDTTNNLSTDINNKTSDLIASTNNNNQSLDKPKELALNPLSNPFNNNNNNVGNAA